jgi:hypothetical protein
MIGMSSATSFEQEQELIISPKNKKKYVSEQQYAELDGQMFVVTHEDSLAIVSLQGSLVNLQQIIIAIQGKVLSALNDYIDGEKDGFLKQANKVQRTDCYEKLIKLKNKIESYTQKVHKVQQQIDSMCIELQQQFQEVLNAECVKIQSE